MVIKSNKKGQAAIEFLMTYGWMLLVVLIVGALIFSFVDFGSLLPNRLDLSNNLRGDPTSSIAYSKDSPLADANKVMVVFRYTGAKRVTIDSIGNEIQTELGESCGSTEIRNLDMGESATTGGLPFLNGNDGLMVFNCGGPDGNVIGGLLDGDTLVGNIKIFVSDPKTQLDVPSTGSIRLQIITG